MPFFALDLKFGLHYSGVCNYYVFLVGEIMLLLCILMLNFAYLCGILHTYAEFRIIIHERR